MIIGQTLRVQFVTINTSGSPVNADATPTALIRKNGSTVAGATVTVTNLGTGLYLASVTLAVGDGWAVGDAYSLQASWAVSSTSFAATLAQGVIEDDIQATLNAIKGGSWSVETLKAIYDLVSTRLATAGYTAPDNASIATLTSRLTSGRAANLDNLDAQVSTRLATASYTAPDNAGISTLLSRLSSARAGFLDYLDAAISSRLAGGSYTAPDNPGIAAIKAKTDQLAFTAGKVDANASVAIDGTTAASIASGVAQQLGGVKITLTSPIAQSGQITLYQGDDYNSGEARALTFTGSGWASLLGATAVLKCVPRTGSEINLSGAISGSGSNQTVTVEVANSAFSGVTPGNHTFSYFLIATLASGRKVTLTSGRLVVVPRGFSS